jgi:uncharacterized membrane protein
MFADNPLFLIPLLSGLIFMVAGLIMIKFPPSSINKIYGYRTGNSMKTKERWDFAQQYSSKQMLIYGALGVFAGLIGSTVKLSESIALGAGLAIVLLMAAIPIIRTEIALKKKFDHK